MTSLQPYNTQQKPLVSLVSQASTAACRARLPPSMLQQQQLGEKADSATLEASAGCQGLNLKQQQICLHVCSPGVLIPAVTIQLSCHMSQLPAAVP